MEDGLLGSKFPKSKLFDCDAENATLTLKVQIMADDLDNFSSLQTHFSVKDFQLVAIRPVVLRQTRKIDAMITDYSVPRSKKAVCTGYSRLMQTHETS